MAAIKTILVVVDPTVEESAAVAKAAHIARACGARLELHICDFSPALDAARYFDPATLAVAVEPVAARHQLHLDSLAEPLRAAGHEVAVSVGFENPLHEGIVHQVSRLHPDLVVKDTHYHGALRRSLFTNTDWYLIRDCPAPLLLTKQFAWHEPVRVAAAVDPNHPGDLGAQLDHDIIDRAAELAAVLGTTPSIVHVFSTLHLISIDPGMAGAPGAPLPLDPAVVEALRTLHQTQLDGLAQRHQIAARNAWLVEGIVVYALPEFVAEHGIDVVALGAIARSRLRERVIGSTAERVLDRLPSDLLIVRPRGARPP
ncbi:MAG TPA: universal stress protein [Steroidobacteraceae bacterium]|nr:universal stress protein [Steroidobacteraceae bacterium]